MTTPITHDEQGTNAFMLPEDFFERDEIISLESIRGGHLFCNVLLKLYAKFLKNGGKIAGKELSAEQTLALIAKVARIRLIDARMACEVFLEKGFMEEREGCLYLLELPPCTAGEKGGAGGGE